MRQRIFRAPGARRQPERDGAGVRLERQRGAMRGEGGGIQGPGRRAPIRGVRVRPVHERPRCPRGGGRSTARASRRHSPRRRRRGAPRLRPVRRAARDDDRRFPTSMRRGGETRRVGVLPRLRRVRSTDAPVPAVATITHSGSNVRSNGRNAGAVLHRGRGADDVSRGGTGGGGRGGRRGGDAGAILLRSQREQEEGDPDETGLRARRVEETCVTVRLVLVR
mmetsp:Transcript_4865/g.20018  ORF Transcript_4865/g.20018 Transcript_4865/m.20018 type:complete len:222 (+) Transcript_4865:342-1007(+)